MQGHRSNGGQNTTTIPLSRPGRVDAGVDVGASNAGTDAGTIPYCDDGILQTDLGEQCDLGKLNGVRLDDQENPTDSTSDYVHCNEACEVPVGVHP